VGVLGLLAVLLVFLIVHDVLFPPSAATSATRTATVNVGSVRSAVTGTGTVVPAAQQNVGFTQSGTLSEVDVKVGDHVSAGQVLAKIDPTQLQQALDQANNSLVQAQATLDSTVNGNGLTQAQHNLASAQQSLADSQNQVNLTNQQDANAVANGQNQVSADQASLNTANAALAAAQSDPHYTGAKANADAARNAYLAACTTSPPASNCAQAQQDYQAAQQVLGVAQAPVTAAQQAASQAQSAFNTDSAKLATDQTKQNADQASGQRTINTATAAVTTAQDNLNSQSVQRPNTIASQQAAVSNAQLAVATAQRNLNNATLTAPFDGTVLSVNGQVGENVTAGAAATAQAPGTTAPQPGSSGATSTAGGSSGSGGSGASGASGFLTLGNVSGLEVVAPFAEADAARLAPSQTATVTFDAVPNLTAGARVLAVAATASVISNVTNYYATLVINNVDQRLKAGMTANANVIVQSVSGVLTLPNSAITRIGGTSYVNLLGRDGKTTTRQPVQTGTVGDQTTEIVSGLNQGDKVVPPQLSRTTNGNAAGGRGGFGGGGGGGGVRVGGGGG
jgi:HlyD family secretion protein